MLINPQVFIEIAEEKAKKMEADKPNWIGKIPDMNNAPMDDPTPTMGESRKHKSVIRLTESQLKNIIIESVKNLLREFDEPIEEQDWDDAVDLLAQLAKESGFDIEYDQYNCPYTYWKGYGILTWNNSYNNDPQEDVDKDVSGEVEIDLNDLLQDLIPQEQYDRCVDWVRENFSKEMFEKVLSEIADNEVSSNPEMYDDDDYEPDYYDEWRDSQF